MNPWNVASPARPGEFIGRDEQLHALVRNLVLEPKPIVLLHGARGMGKTSLVQEFARSSGQAFPGGIEVQYPHSLRNSNRIEFRSIDANRRSLFVIEDAILFSGKTLTSILNQLAGMREVSTLIVSDIRPRSLPKGAAEIHVGPLNLAEWERLVKNNLYAIDKETAQRFFRQVNGHPALLSLAATSVSEGIRSLQDLLRQLEPFEEPGILSPDGRPYDPNVSLPEPIIEVCTHLEAKLFDAVSRNPDLMYTISPRDFELLVAELLHRQGFNIQVTPPSRDGGVDMYAAKSNELGNFLFLVECKKYAKSNPVQVDVVRALYGNVQAKRATSGVVVTTSTFTRGAKAFQSELRHQLELRDYLTLRDWIAKVRPK